MPARIAACACSIDIAGPTRALRVPCAILRISRCSCAGSRSATPASTTDSARPWMRANTDTGNWPVNACRVRSAVPWPAAAETPSTARPWSLAKSTSCGLRKRGLSVFWIRPTRIASGSSSPRLPAVSPRRASLSRSARSSSGLAVGAISEWAAGGMGRTV
jgi:hypothetical protein